MTRQVKHPGLDPERINKEETLLTELANGLKYLSDKQLKWMEGMIVKYESVGALDQWSWEKVDQMLQIIRSNYVVAENAPTEFKNFKSVLVMFQIAGSHLKRPKVMLANEKGARMRLTFNGPQTESDFFRNTVVVRYGNETTSPMNLGAIDIKSGTFRMYKSGRIYPEYTKEALELINMFAEDPAGVAKASAAIIGCCSFCSLPLSDPRSKAVGYGATCASHYRLPWGSEEEGTSKVYKEINPSKTVVTN